MVSDWMTVSWDEELDPLAALGLASFDAEVPGLAKRYCFTREVASPVNSVVLVKAAPGFRYGIAVEKNRQSLRCELKLRREKRQLLQELLGMLESDARLVLLHLQKLGAGPMG